MTTDRLLLAKQQHRLMHDIYVLMDDGDRRVLAPLNLSPLEFAVLQQLDMEQGQRLTDVGAKLLCVKSTITRIVDRLEREGLVLRTPDPDDRRAQRLLLTTHGAAVRMEGLTAHNRAIERRMSVLSLNEQQQLQALLTKLRAGLQENLDEVEDEVAEVAAALHR
ncbi:MAG: MarR family winged helix-turn-helix transcriptional regulator [Chloroflexaceae bacterium]